MSEIKKRPSGNGCYHSLMLGTALICPHLDETNPIRPICLKYVKNLMWNRSGFILKDVQCLEESKS